MREIQLPKQLQQKLAEQQARKQSSKIDEEWLFVARFGKHYGWQGVKAILDNEISLETAKALLEGGDKVDAARTIDSAVGTQVATASVNAKKGQAHSVFKKGMKHFIKKAEL